MPPGKVPLRGPGGLFAGSTSADGSSNSGGASTTPQTGQTATGTSSGGGEGGGGLWTGNHPTPQDTRPGPSPQLPEGTPQAPPAAPEPQPRDTPESRRIDRQISDLKTERRRIQAALASGGSPDQQRTLIHQQEAIDLHIKQLEDAASHARTDTAPAATGPDSSSSKEAGMATVAPDIVYATFPIEKTEDDGGTLYVYGKATTPEVDTDDQVVDKEFSAEALKRWFETGPNVRVQHNSQRDPAGSGVRVDLDRDGDGAHWVKAAIDEPVAQRLVRKGHLRAFSVGIAKPLIVRDVTGKARGGIIKGGELAEISLVDRPANRSCYVELAKAAADGHCEFTGKTVGDDVLAKGADVKVPKSAAGVFSPGDLAKLLGHRQVAEDREAEALKAMDGAEAAVLGKKHREFSAADRKRLAARGHSLPDGSYPIPDKDALRRAAILARSGHGNVAAARKLIARRAKELGVANPLDEDDAVKKEAAPAETAAPDAVAKDDSSDTDDDGALHHDDGDDDDTDSEADALDKTATPDMAKKPKMPCPKCSKLNKAKAKFCGKCGAPMAAEKASMPTPGDGVTGEHTEPVPPHREPDGPAFEAFEHDAGLPTVPDSSVKADDDTAFEVAAMHKAMGVPLDMGMLHDLTCAAYSPADVAKAHPGADFTLIDAATWQAKALDVAASAPLDEARKAARVWQDALSLKSVTAELAADIQAEAHKAFRDANPGPGKAPTPGELHAERFNRPLITAGHSAPSPGQDPPHKSPIHPAHISAADFRRDLITAGHGADSPDNAPSRPEPVPAPEVPGVPSRVYYTNVQRQNAQQAMRNMHDHIASTFPDLCPMHGPGRMGEPPSHARPVPAGVGGPVPHGATKTAAPEPAPAVDIAKAARKAAKRDRRRVMDDVLLGLRTIDDARTELGITLPVPAVTKAADSEPLLLEAKGADPELIKNAVTDGLGPILERLDAQQRLLDAMADQPDPRVAAYRGPVLPKTAAAPAGPLSSPQHPAGAQDIAYRAMYDQWRNSPDPGLREDALNFLLKRSGLTGQHNVTPMA